MTLTLQSPKLPRDARQRFGVRELVQLTQTLCQPLPVENRGQLRDGRNVLVNSTSPASRIDHDILLTGRLSAVWEITVVCHVKRTRVKRKFQIHCITQSRILC